MDMVVRQDDDGQLSVLVGEKTSGILTLGETIEQIISLINFAPRKPHQYPMLTESEWEDRYK